MPFLSSGFALGIGEETVPAPAPREGPRGDLWFCPPGASPAATVGSPWDHDGPGRAVLGIPTALLFPDSCFSGLGIEDTPFSNGSNSFFILRAILGKHP